MWKYSVKNKITTAFLHDCCIKRIVLKKNELSFDFPSGISLYPKTHENPNEIAVRTKEARIRFTSPDTLIYIFKDIRFFGKKLFTIRKTMELSELMEKVNSGKWYLEIYREFYQKLGAGEEAFYECAIFGGGSYSEIQMFIYYKELIFSWN